MNYICISAASIGFGDVKNKNLLVVLGAMMAQLP